MPILGLLELFRIHGLGCRFVRADRFGGRRNSHNPRIRTIGCYPSVYQDLRLSLPRKLSRSRRRADWLADVRS